ncbi:MAG: cobyrinic acid a,c-diamide synthase, partial [Alphaproteobacteria bacterium]
ALPSRHLGLVQAAEHPALEAMIERAADLAVDHLDLDALMALARRARLAGPVARLGVPPPGQRIALAADAAFAFAYPAQLEAWRAAGAEVRSFSPLADKSPDADADAIVLPGGYPELHAARLAANARFLCGVRAAGARGATVYGECGGYMVLGEALIDAEGMRHAMAGLLPLVTTFAEPRLALGYRDLMLAADTPLGPRGARFRGHEFHYATTLAGGGAPLFHARDANDHALGPAGMVAGRVCGSFLHLIDSVDDRS